MPAITIRHVPEHIRDELAARAARTGRSLQEYLLAELAELAERPDPEDWLARVRSRAVSAGADLDVAEMLADRDADRR